MKRRALLFSVLLATACGGSKTASPLSCNPGAHPEVVVRVDGTPGQVWTITASRGLAFATYVFETMAPTTCGAYSVTVALQ